MSRVRGRGNKDTELALAKLFRRHSITGWRRNQAVFGKPDFIFQNLKLAIFVDGCFWHGCPKHCKYAKWLLRNVTANNPPSPRNGLRRTGRAFWRRKLAGNKTRDRLVTRTLRKAGWRVLRIWEHELARKNEPKLVKRIQRALD